MYLYKRQTNKQSDMSSPCVLVLSRPGQRVFFRLSGANIKYLLYFCKMSLNGSFFKGGGGGEENKSCNVVPMQLLTSRVQPGCSGHRLFSSCFVCFVFVFFYRGCGVPVMGLDRGFSAGCPPGPRPWMSTLGTRGLWRLGCGAVGVRYILLYMAAAAAAAVVLSTVPSRLGW